MNLGPSVGAVVLPDGRTRFRVWAPRVSSVALQLEGSPPRLLPLTRTRDGYFETTVAHAPAGSRYWFQLDGERLRPDPASRWQPEGVHGPSAVVDPAAFHWSSPFWRVPALEDYVIYELHVGTFTAGGTFDAALAELDRLRQIGITAIELMPVNEFPGDRNWGYDGAYPFAAKSTYGGPDGLARFVDGCHQRGLAVILDVVYNHFGPAGAYAGEFGHYYSDRYRTLWGDAINFDGPGSDEVRRFFIDSALYWLRDLRVDAFRLDAIHAIFDQSAIPFLRQFTETIHTAARALGRPAYVIAESDLNDPRVIRAPESGGFGFDAQWSDDFHHALHTSLTDERGGIYHDFDGTADLKQAYARGFVYAGQYSPTRERMHGAPPGNIRPTELVVCVQNHDQIGNRAVGDRLTETLNLAQLKLAAASTLLSPFTPLIFMGEEYGETAPFQFFTSHSDPDLTEAVRRGRAEEFKAYGWTEGVPDPQAEETFNRSKLVPEHRTSAEGQTLQSYYQELLRLRRTLPALADRSFVTQDIERSGTQERVLRIRRRNREHEAFLALNFSDEASQVTLPRGDAAWAVMLDSSDQRWGGDRKITADRRLRSSDSIDLAAWSAVLAERLVDDSVVAS
ncbi:MAG TPA: malto-oligosyltrehalose trehalohydrolase [Nitrolancea sp.]|nr:malto-oligosyltrehalose trehalohydrolase [Nitrolancea sp.]